jgi:hypothetical protein
MGEAQALADLRQFEALTSESDTQVDTWARARYRTRSDDVSDGPMMGRIARLVKLT